MIESTSFRFWPTALVLIGAIPLLTAQLWYRIGLLAWAEIGPIRTLGLLGAMSLVGASVALVVAGLVWALRVRGVADWLGHVARTVLFTGIVANVAAVGLALVAWSPILAPMHYKLGAAVSALAMVIAFARNRVPYQVLVLRCLAGLGLGLLSVPLLASPWIVGAAMQHSNQLKGAVPPSAGEVRPDRPQRIVLVTFDALAAGRTSLYNPSLDNTPSLEAIARESTWYTRARSSSDGTVVSLGTILTGLSPSTIQPQLYAKLGYIPWNAVTGIAGHLKSAGYRSVFATMIAHPTAFGMGDEYEKGTFNCRQFFSSAFHSRDFLPLKEAFRFSTKRLSGNRSELGEAGFEQTALKAVPKTISQAARFIRESKGPTFLWLHVGAPHLPYSRIPEFKPGIRPKRVVTVEESKVANKKADPATALEIRGVYDDYVQYVDHELGNLVADMKANGLWHDALVIVTSDHGESHRPGRIGHGGGPLFKEQSYIPLVIKVNGRRLEARVDHVVGHIDLAPTILGQVYRKVPTGFPGTPLLTAKVPADRTLFTYGWVARDEGNHTYPRSMAAYHDRFVFQTDVKSGQEALFDTSVDPEETTDVSAHYPEVVNRLRVEVQAELMKF